MSYVDDSSCSCVLSSIFDELIGNLYFISNVLATNFVFAKTEGTAFSSACWAFAPANWANTFTLMITCWIAESATLNLVFMAD